ncbi:unnamed protein product [Paramecium primaurelia]|uniref:Uncharacterized protein n=2 Tax=Paramecium TaxID=5884 RepID=A0A8S1XMV0_9CILI|nr:unnamed protein product [Paramecium primaurelia]CAD8202720.1 unnamed protein product [Paramecium pentaurelia]
MSFFGKVFLLTALAGYSYLLLTDVTLGKQFDTKYANFQQQALIKQYIPADVFKHVPALLAKQIVGGLLASSVLLFICGGFVVFPVLGLLLQIAIQSNPLFSNDQVTQIECLKLTALIGGLLIWATSNCCTKQTTKTKTE